MFISPARRHQTNLLSAAQYLKASEGLMPPPFVTVAAFLRLFTSAVILQAIALIFYAN
jgi:hypothetical protein